MLLSESEAFWVSMLHEQLVNNSSLLSPIEDADLEADTSTIAAALRHGQRPEAEDSESAALKRGFKVYEQIRDLAISFGIARKPDLCVVCDGKPVEPPADIAWSTWGGHTLSPEDFGEVQASVRERVAATQETLEACPEEARHHDGFIRSVRDFQACLVAGYAPSTPGVLYHLSAHGDACVFGRVAPRDRGLYLSLLQLFRDTLPLPPLERMAMAAAGYPDDRLSRNWKPVVFSLEKPFGSFAPEAVEHTLTSFKESNEKRDGWNIAWCLTTLLSDARRLSNQFDEAVQSSPYEDEDRRPTLSDMFKMAGSHIEVGARSDADEETATDEERAESLKISFRTPAEIVTAFASYCCHKIEETLDGHEEEDDDEKEEREMRESSDGFMEYELDKELSAFRQLADVASQHSRLNGLASVAEMIVEAKRAAPVLRPDNPLESWLGEMSVELLGKLSDGFNVACALLEDARKVAYGELRLKDLKWDEHGLPSTALSGWSRQNENIRSAIKVAIDQLNNGLPPYVVLTQLAPASETLVRQLAAKHLTNFQGMNPGKLLHELRQTVGLGPDDHKDRTTLSVAQALVSLRNWVVHEPDGERGRDHAAFFLNGVAILLSDL